eukprot:gene1011-331_t
MPGTSEFFYLRKYKEDVGKEYKRLVFFLCSLEDFLSSENCDFGIDDELLKCEPPAKRSTQSLEDQFNTENLADTIWSTEHQFQDQMPLPEASATAVVPDVITIDEANNSNIEIPVYDTANGSQIEGLTFEEKMANLRGDFVGQREDFCLLTVRRSKLWLDMCEKIKCLFSDICSGYLYFLIEFLERISHEGPMHLTTIELNEDGEESEVMKKIGVEEVALFCAGSKYITPSMKGAGTICFDHEGKYGRIVANTCNIILAIPVTERRVSFNEDRSWNTVSVKDASGLLHCTTTFEFITALVITCHFLEVTLPLTKELQQTEIDVIAATEKINLLYSMLRSFWEEVVQLHDKFYTEDVTIAKAVETVPPLPRIAQLQRHRSNMPADTPTKEVISEFPDGGNVSDYLEAKGLYPSTTYLYLRTKQKNFQERAAELAQEDVEYQSESDSASEFSSNLPCLERIIYGTCSCTYEEGNECTRCTHNKELEETIKADSFNYTKEPQNHSFPVDESAKAGPSQGPSEALSLQQQQEVRERRLAYLSHQATQETSSAYSFPGKSELAHVGTDSLSHQAELETPISFSFDDLIELPHFGVDVATASNTDIQEIHPQPQRHEIKQLSVHRSVICTDLIAHFKDDNIMNAELKFGVIDERGMREEGVGIGVTRDEWEAVGRILVKGFTSAAYFPIYLSKALLCYCLFGRDVPDEMILDSFMRYLSEEEESVVNEQNFRKILVEIAKQELIQKPHVMISSWHPIIQALKQHESVHSIPSVEAFFNNARPTTKKILGILDANPSTDGERDALKFLQRYIRGLDSKAMLQFLRFTTAMDIVVDNIKLEISFIRSEGLGSRPIAHTCGPLLELPSTYTNFVDLRKEFDNILVKDDWNIDIM